MRATAKQIAVTVPLIMRSVSVAGVLTILILVKPSSAQNGPFAAISEPTDYPAAPQSDLQDADSGAPQSGGSEDNTPNIGDVDSELPPVTDLETDLPLKVLLTPLHWGRLSLLSLTAYEGYDSNPGFLKTPLGAAVTSISGLALYTAQLAGWQMSLQYRPFLWISSTETIKDFAAVSFDVRKLHRIGSNWHWTLGDNFRYSPTHSTEQGTGFVANPSGGFSIGNAFLSSGRNVLVNGIAGTLADRYGENSSLTFDANQDFTRLSSYVGTPAAGNPPTQEAMTYSTGVTWRDHFSLRNTFTAEYVYHLQTSTGTSVANVNSNLASVGLSHKLNQSLGISVSAGPAWSTYAGHQNASAPGHGRATVHGSVALSKEFRSGGVVLAFVRSNSFTGVISDSFHNRYDLTAHRELTTRFHASATASYLQQQVSNARSTNGELASAEARYFVSRNWSVFTQVRYLHITGNDRILAPEKNAIVGVRWSWVPEKP